MRIQPFQVNFSARYQYFPDPITGEQLQPGMKIFEIQDSRGFTTLTFEKGIEIIQITDKGTMPSGKEGENHAKGLTRKLDITAYAQGSKKSTLKTPIMVCDDYKFKVMAPQM